MENETNETQEEVISFEEKIQTAKEDLMDKMVGNTPDLIERGLNRMLGKE